MNLGILTILEKNKDRAEEYFRSALNLDPTCVNRIKIIFEKMEIATKYQWKIA